MNDDDVFIRLPPEEPEADREDDSSELFEPVLISDRSVDDPVLWPAIDQDDPSMNSVRTDYRNQLPAERRLDLKSMLVGVALTLALAVVAGVMFFRPATSPGRDGSDQLAPAATAPVERATSQAVTRPSSEPLPSPPLATPPPAARVPSPPTVTNASGAQPGRSREVAPPAIPPPLSSGSAIKAAPRPSAPAGAVTPSGTVPSGAAVATAGATVPPGLGGTSNSVPDQSAPQRTLEEIGPPPTVESVAAPTPAIVPGAARGGVAPIVPATPTPAAIASQALAADEQRVRTVLNGYRSAFGSLDVNAARAVWPTVDTRALGRAFDQLSMQEFEFAACDVSIAGERASADCAGNARWVPKVGGKNARVESRVWHFELHRIDQRWQIDTVATR